MIYNVNLNIGEVFSFKVSWVANPENYVRSIYTLDDNPYWFFFKSKYLTPKYLFFFNYYLDFFVNEIEKWNRIINYNTFINKYIFSYNCLDVVGELQNPLLIYFYNSRNLYYISKTNFKLNMYKYYKYRFGLTFYTFLIQQDFRDDINNASYLMSKYFLNRYIILNNNLSKIYYKSQKNYIEYLKYIQKQKYAINPLKYTEFFDNYKVIFNYLNKNYKYTFYQEIMDSLKGVSYIDGDETNDLLNVNKVQIYDLLFKEKSLKLLNLLSIYHFSFKFIFFNIPIYYENLSKLNRFDIFRRIFEPILFQYGLKFRHISLFFDTILSKNTYNLKTNYWVSNISTLLYLNTIDDEKLNNKFYNDNWIFFQDVLRSIEKGEIDNSVKRVKSDILFSIVNIWNQKELMKFLKNSNVINSFSFGLKATTFYQDRLSYQLNPNNNRLIRQINKEFFSEFWVKTDYIDSLFWLLKELEYTKKRIRLLDVLFLGLFLNPRYQAMYFYGYNKWFNQSKILIISSIILFSEFSDFLNSISINELFLLFSYSSGNFISFPKKRYNFTDFYVFSLLSFDWVFLQFIIKYLSIIHDNTQTIVDTRKTINHFSSWNKKILNTFFQVKLVTAKKLEKKNLIKFNTYLNNTSYLFLKWEKQNKFNLYNLNYDENINLFYDMYLKNIKLKRSNYLSPTEDFYDFGWEDFSWYLDTDLSNDRFDFDDDLFSLKSLSKENEKEHYIEKMSNLIFLILHKYDESNEFFNKNKDIVLHETSNFFNNFKDLDFNNYLNQIYNLFEIIKTYDENLLIDGKINNKLYKDNFSFNDLIVNLLLNNLNYKEFDKNLINIHNLLKKDIKSKNWNIFEYRRFNLDLFHNLKLNNKLNKYIDDLYINSFSFEQYKRHQLNLNNNLVFALVNKEIVKKIRFNSLNFYKNFILFEENNQLNRDRKIILNFMNKELILMNFFNNFNKIDLFSNKLITNLINESNFQKFNIFEKDTYYKDLMNYNLFSTFKEKNFNYYLQTLNMKYNNNFLNINNGDIQKRFKNDISFLLFLELFNNFNKNNNNTLNNLKKYNQIASNAWYSGDLLDIFFGSEFNLVPENETDAQTLREAMDLNFINDFSVNYSNFFFFHKFQNYIENYKDPFIYFKGHFLDSKVFNFDANYGFYLNSYDKVKFFDYKLPYFFFDYNLLNLYKLKFDSFKLQNLYKKAFDFDIKDLDSNLTKYKSFNNLDFIFLNPVSFFSNQPLDSFEDFYWFFLDKIDYFNKNLKFLNSNLLWIDYLEEILYLYPNKILKISDDYEKYTYLNALSEKKKILYQQVFKKIQYDKLSFRNNFYNPIAAKKNFQKLDIFTENSYNFFYQILKWDFDADPLLRNRLFFNRLLYKWKNSKELFLDYSRDSRDDFKNLKLDNIDKDFLNTYFSSNNYEFILSEDPIEFGEFPEKRHRWDWEEFNISTELEDHWLEHTNRKFYEPNFVFDYEDHLVLDDIWFLEDVPADIKPLIFLYVNDFVEVFQPIMEELKETLYNMNIYKSYISNNHWFSVGITNDLESLNSDFFFYKKLGSPINILYQNLNLFEWSGLLNSEYKKAPAYIDTLRLNSKYNIYRNIFLIPHSNRLFKDNKLFNKTDWIFGETLDFSRFFSSYFFLAKYLKTFDEMQSLAYKKGITNPLFFGVADPFNVNIKSFPKQIEGEIFLKYYYKYQFLPFNLFSKFKIFNDYFLKPGFKNQGHNKEIPLPFYNTNKYGEYLKGLNDYTNLHPFQSLKELYVSNFVNWYYWNNKKSDFQCWDLDYIKENYLYFKYIYNSVPSHWLSSNFENPYNLYENFKERVPYPYIMTINKKELTNIKSSSRYFARNLLLYWIGVEPIYIMPVDMNFIKSSINWKFTNIRSKNSLNYFDPTRSDWFWYYYESPLNVHLNNDFLKLDQLLLSNKLKETQFYGKVPYRLFKKWNIKTSVLNVKEKKKFDEEFDLVFKNFIWTIRAYSKIDKIFKNRKLKSVIIDKFDEALDDHHFITVYLRDKIWKNFLDFKAPPDKYTKSKYLTLLKKKEDRVKTFLLPPTWPRDPLLKNSNINFYTKDNLLILDHINILLKNSYFPDGTVTKLFNKLVPIPIDSVSIINSFLTNLEIIKPVSSDIIDINHVFPFDENVFFNLLNFTRNFYLYNGLNLNIDWNTLNTYFDEKKIDPLRKPFNFKFIDHISKNYIINKDNIIYNNFYYYKDSIEFLKNFYFINNYNNLNNYSLNNKKNISLDLFNTFNLYSYFFPVLNKKWHKLNVIDQSNSFNLPQDYTEIYKHKMESATPYFYNYPIFTFVQESSENKLLIEDKYIENILLNYSSKYSSWISYIFLDDLSLPLLSPKIHKEDWISNNLEYPYNLITSSPYLYKSSIYDYKFSIYKYKWFFLKRFSHYSFGIKNDFFDLKTSFNNLVTENMYYKLRSDLNLNKNQSINLLQLTNSKFTILDNFDLINLKNENIFYLFKKNFNDLSSNLYISYKFNKLFVHSQFFDNITNKPGKQTLFYFFNNFFKQLKKVYNIDLFLFYFVESFSEFIFDSINFYKFNFNINFRSFILDTTIFNSINFNKFIFNKYFYLDNFYNLFCNWSFFTSFSYFNDINLFFKFRDFYFSDNIKMNIFKWLTFFNNEQLKSGNGYNILFLFKNNLKLFELFFNLRILNNYKNNLSKINLLEFLNLHNYISIFDFNFNTDFYFSNDLKYLINSWFTFLNNNNLKKDEGQKLLFIYKKDLNLYNLIINMSYWNLILNFNKKLGLNFYLKEGIKGFIHFSYLGANYYIINLKEFYLKYLMSKNFSKYYYIDILKYCGHTYMTFMNHLDFKLDFFLENSNNYDSRNLEFILYNYSLYNKYLNKIFNNFNYFTKISLSDLFYSVFKKKKIIFFLKNEQNKFFSLNINCLSMFKVFDFKKNIFISLKNLDNLSYLNYICKYFYIKYLQNFGIHYSEFFKIHRPYLYYNWVFNNFNFNTFILDEYNFIRNFNFNNSYNWSFMDWGIMNKIWYYYFIPEYNKVFEYFGKNSKEFPKFYNSIRLNYLNVTMRNKLIYYGGSTYFQKTLKQHGFERHYFWINPLKVLIYISNYQDKNVEVIYLNNDEIYNLKKLFYWNNSLKEGDILWVSWKDLNKYDSRIYSRYNYGINKNWRKDYEGFKFIELWKFRVNPNIIISYSNMFWIDSYWNKLGKKIPFNLLEENSTELWNNNIWKHQTVFFDFESMWDDSNIWSRRRNSFWGQKRIISYLPNKSSFYSRWVKIKFDDRLKP